MLDALSSADPVLYFLGFASALKLSLYYRWLEKKTEDKLEYVGKVTDFCLYPLKSGRAANIKELECTFQEGPHHKQTTDRRWMVTTADNVAVNYQQFPRLSTITPTCGDNSFTMVGPGANPLVVNPAKVEKEGKSVDISAYGVTVKGLDCGDDAATWVNNFLQTSGHRLVYAPPDFDTGRPVAKGSQKFADWVKKAKPHDAMAYQSVTPYHVITWESLEDLNSRLETPVKMDRFRPNIIIKGDKPYSEDTWQEMIIGNTRFSTIKLTGRCIFTCINPDTGAVGVEPLKTLNKYRNLIPDPVFGPVMGIHMVLEKPGTIKVGDPVYVIRGDNTIKP